MSKPVQLYKDRIEASLDAWDKILRGDVSTRPELENLLVTLYKQRGVEPFRGLSKIRIYDKEIATVYVVGKYGLAVVDDSSISQYIHLLQVETIGDEVYGKLKSVDFSLSDELRSYVRDKVDVDVMGETLEERVFRAYRLVYTGSIMGFMPETDFVKMYSALLDVFPQLSERLINYVRFYVATKIAEKIALGQITNLDDKKIEKYAYCVRLGLTKCAPSDKLIREIAAKVYKVPRSVVGKLFPNVDAKSFVPRAT